MFWWVGYKKRLQDVRRQLVEAEEAMEKPDLKKVAVAVATICKALVRVIDSLPD